MNRKYNHLYAIPYYLWLGLFVILPLVLVLGSSFFDIHGNFTLANYAEYFSSINYIKMTMNSFIYAGLLTIITLALSYPMAYLLSKTKHRQLWMLLVLLPTWINLLLKAYAFIGLLSQTGSVNQFLTFMGIGPKQLLFTDAAFLLVAGYIELPFMIMPIYNSITEIPRGWAYCRRRKAEGTWCKWIMCGFRNGLMICLEKNNYLFQYRMNLAKNQTNGN